MTTPPNTAVAPTAPERLKP